MGTRAQNFRHGTFAFWGVNVTKIGTGAAKFKRAETFSRGSLGTSSKRCRAQISNKNKKCVRHRACAKQIVLFPTWQQAAKNYNLPKIKKKS